MRALVALAVFLAACGGPPRPAAPSNDTGYLVWSVEAEHSRTVWFGSDGAERGRADGIWLYTDGALWRVEDRSDERTVRSCETDDAGKAMSSTVSAVYPTLLSADGKTRLVPWPTSLDEVDELATYDLKVVLAASLGDRLFFLSYLDVFACGAHGSQSADAAEYEVPSRRLTNVDASPADARTTAAVEAALAEPIDRLDDDGWSVGATVPSWRGPALAARHLVFVDTCYACGNGEWSSYTWGEWVEDVRVPDGWARPEVPASVRTALAGDSPRGVSWGAPDATWTATFAAR